MVVNGFCKISVYTDKRFFCATKNLGKITADESRRIWTDATDLGHPASRYFGRRGGKADILNEKTDFFKILVIFVPKIRLIW
jgi:hypothetical protein